MSELNFGELAVKLQHRLLASSDNDAPSDIKRAEEEIAEGMSMAAYTSDPLIQRWITYLSAAVNMRYIRHGWLKSSSNSSKYVRMGRSHLEQSDLVALNTFDTFNQLYFIEDSGVWADSFLTFISTSAAEEIANHFFIFREAGFDPELLQALSCEMLSMLDRWLGKIPESCISEEIIGNLTGFCAELVRYKNSVMYFLQSAQLSENENNYDNLKSCGGLELIFTSAYQLFPLIPMPITQIFASCAYSCKESAESVQNIFANMACFTVQLPPTFAVTDYMQLTHQNECAEVTIRHPWKPPGGLHLVLPHGTKGIVLSHHPENGAVNRVLFQHKYNAFEWFAAVTSSVASDAVQLDDGTVLDLLTEVAKLFCGLAKNLEASIWYDTAFTIVGPFSRLGPCLSAVRESSQLIKQVVTIIAAILNFLAALALRCPEEVAVIMDDYWAPVLTNRLYGELLSTYECRYADFQITSALCSLMSAFFETKYFEWMFGDTVRKNLVGLFDLFLHSCLANVTTWRFNFLKKRVDHLRSIYALSALIFDVHSLASSKTSDMDAFENFFIINPLLSQVSNSLSAKVIEFCIQVAESSGQGHSCQQIIVLPSLQSLISAIMSCMLRFYRFITSPVNKCDILSTISVGSAELIKATEALCSSASLELNSNNRRLCFDLLAIIITYLGNSLSLNGLLSMTERKRFQTIIVDTISEEEKYVTSESADNSRLMLIQSTMNLVEAIMQFQPVFFADLSSRIRSLVMSILTRYELFQSLPSLYVATLKIIVAAWKYSRHQNFSKQLIDDAGDQNFWASVLYPLECEVFKEEPFRRFQISCLLAVFDILSLELFHFCRSGNCLNGNLTQKLCVIFDSCTVHAKLEAIFDYLLLNQDESEFSPLAPIYSAAAATVETFLVTLSTISLPEQLVKPRQQLDIIDSCVSVCIDLLTDLKSYEESKTQHRSVLLCRFLLPPFLRGILMVIRGWSQSALISNTRSRNISLKGTAAVLNITAPAAFAKCIDLCRMVMAANATRENELPIRFDEPGILILTIVAELLKYIKADPSIAIDSQEWFPGLAADIVTQMLATETDGRVESNFFSAALSVLNALILTPSSEVVEVFLKNEIFICKLVECTAQSIHEGRISSVNIDALTFLLNITHSLNTWTYLSDQRQQGFCVRRILSSLSNAFYNHAIFECSLAGSFSIADTMTRSATVLIIDIITALLMHFDNSRNFFVDLETICTFLAVYNSKYIKLASSLSPSSDGLFFHTCSAWMRMLERITARIAVQHQNTAHQSSSDLNITEIVCVFFMNSFILLNNFHNSNISLDRSEWKTREEDIVRFCQCSTAAVLKVCPSLTHIIHGDLLRGGRQVLPIVEADFSLVSLGCSSPSNNKVRLPQTITFGLLFACFHTTIRRMRRPSDGGLDIKQTQSVSMTMIATVLHGLLQLIVSQAVLHLQLIRSNWATSTSAYKNTQISSIAPQIQAFNDQLKGELGTCFARFRRFINSLTPSKLTESEGEDFQALATVYEQILCK